MPRHPSVRGQPPEPGLLILVSLAGGPKHGYAVISDGARLANVSLGSGTLYAALARLESHGLIESLPDVDRRRPYQLTRLGRMVLEERLVSMAQLAEAGLGRLAGV